MGVTDSRFKAFELDEEECMWRLDECRGWSNLDEEEGILLLVEGLDWKKGYFEDVEGNSQQSSDDRLTRHSVRDYSKESSVLRNWNGFCDLKGFWRG